MSIIRCAMWRIHLAYQIDIGSLFGELGKCHSRLHGRLLIFKADSGAIREEVRAADLHSAFGADDNSAGPDEIR
jgi:hypothetical protein